MYQTEHYFITAACVASELHEAMLVAKRISLASSNAGVLAVKAGSNAAGFGALAVFLEELARKTVSASHSINQKAISMSRLASNAARTQSAVLKFKLARTKGAEAKFIESIDVAVENANHQSKQFDDEFTIQIQNLKSDLESLKRELDVTKVLASMSQVEAAQAGKEYSFTLRDNALSIADAANTIESHVQASLKLVDKLQRSRRQSKVAMC